MGPYFGSIIYQGGCMGYRILEYFSLDWLPINQRRRGGGDPEQIFHIIPLTQTTVQPRICPTTTHFNLLLQNFQTYFRCVYNYRDSATRISAFIFSSYKQVSVVKDHANPRFSQNPFCLFIWSREESRNTVSLRTTDFGLLWHYHSLFKTKCNSFL